MSKKMMALLSIVESDKGKKLIKELEKMSVRLNFQIVGFGTAPTEMLDIFGLGSNDKDIVVSLGAERDIKDLIARFGEVFQSHSKYGGIMIILDVAAASRVLNEVLNFSSQNTEKEALNMQNQHHNNLIVISVNEGYSEDVMQAARKAGATGGTVIKGRLADIDQFAEFENVSADEEREILLILAPHAASQRIMESVNSGFGLSSQANGIIFALPTEKAFKI